jgi:hypothetical protein
MWMMTPPRGEGLGGGVDGFPAKAGTTNVGEAEAGTSFSFPAEAGTTNVVAADFGNGEFSRGSLMWRAARKLSS